jgi:hypothetical protein
VLRVAPFDVGIVRVLCVGRETLVRGGLLEQPERLLGAFRWWSPSVGVLAALFAPWPPLSRQYVPSSPSTRPSGANPVRADTAAGPPRIGSFYYRLIAGGIGTVKSRRQRKPVSSDLRGKSSNCHA